MNKDSQNINYLGGINYSWITDNIAVGGFVSYGCDASGNRRREYTDEEMLSDACGFFDVVALCCDEIQPSSTDISNAIVVHMGFRETVRPASLNEEHRNILKENIPKLDRLITGDSKALISCAMGAARSPLVTASLLIHRGMAPYDAVKLIFDKRCFSNFVYIDHLLHGHESDYETRWVPTLMKRRTPFFQKLIGSK